MRLCHFMAYEFSRNLERYAYNNPTIQPGEELSVRGFQMIHGPVRLERQVCPIEELFWFK